MIRLRPIIVALSLQFVATAGHAQPSSGPMGWQYNGGTPDYPYLVNVLPSLSGSCTDGVCTIVLGDIAACPSGQYMTDVTSGAAVCSGTVDGGDSGSGTTRQSGTTIIKLSTHNTDCTSRTDGKPGEVCIDEDDFRAWECIPTSGDCSGAEWKPHGTILVQASGSDVGGAKGLNFSSNLSAGALTNGVVTIDTGANVRHENEALGCGDLPQNIQCVNGVPKTFGASNQASAGYYATKRCIGGANSGATCTANSECPGTASVGCDTLADHFEILSSRVYAGDGLTLPFDKPFFVQNMPTRVRSTQLQGHWVSEAADIPSTASNERRILGCARARPIVINEICCVADATSYAGLTLRRDGPPPTPAPTIALPTPAACATPNPNTTGAGCTTTGLPLTIPQNACVSYTITTATGLNALTVTLNGTITDE